MHSFRTTVNFAFYTSDIGIPDSVGSSMRMAYVITEMNALTTNITLCHDDTSLSLCIFATFLIISPELNSQH